MFSIEFELFHDGQKGVAKLKELLAQNMKGFFEEAASLLPEMNLQYLERVEHGICSINQKKTIAP